MLWVPVFASWLFPSVCPSVFLSVYLCIRLSFYLVEFASVTDCSSDTDFCMLVLAFEENTKYTLRQNSYSRSALKLKFCFNPVLKTGFQSFSSLKFLKLRGLFAVVCAFWLGGISSHKVCLNGVPDSHCIHRHICKILCFCYQNCIPTGAHPDQCDFIIACPFLACFIFAVLVVELSVVRPGHQLSGRDLGWIFAEQSDYSYLFFFF